MLIAKDSQGVEVVKGDTVVVAARGIKVRGVVVEAYWWGEDYGWDLELDQANVPGGYSRWKQKDDGGRIVEVNGKEV